jgi:hypothetical protein
MVIDALNQVKPQRGLAGGFTVKQISHMTKIHPERVLQALVRLEGVKPGNSEWRSDCPESIALFEPSRRCILPGHCHYL